MKIKLILILLCVFVCNMAWTSEIDPISTAEAIPKAALIIEAKLDSQKTVLVEKFDDNFIDRKVIYYSISDLKVIKGAEDFYTSQTFYCMAPFPEFRRDKDGKKIKFGISAKTEGTGREFVLDNKKRYIFFIKQFSQGKLQVIRVEESTPKKLNEIGVLIGHDHGPAEIEIAL